MVGSFGGDYTQFQTDTVAALARFKSSGVQQLIVDTTGNGGGYVCLGQFFDSCSTNYIDDTIKLISAATPGEFLINALAGTSFGYA